MLQNIIINHFRNIEHAEFSPSTDVSLVVGHNASGKTSVLEAVSLVFTGRSFRTPRLDQLITHRQKHLQLIAKYSDQGFHTHTVGFERAIKKSLIRHDGQTLSSIIQLAAQIPVHIIQPDTHLLLELGPKFRRQFIDWGVFHVEPSYLSLWKNYHRSLRQRNALLRQGAPRSQIQAWDKPLSEQALELHNAREKYFNILIPRFLQVCKELLEDEPVIIYRCGWDDTQEYLNVLKNTINSDLEHGFTQAGCHRADIALRTEGKAPQYYYSRGQQKLLISALRIAHFITLAALNKPEGILLVDDLPAELDSIRRQRFLKLVARTRIQTIITATENEQLSLHEWPSQKVFHVERGVLREVI